MFQLNARVPEETKEQLDVIVEHYRSQVTVGRVSQSHVLQDIIKKAYEDIKNKK
ncbi:hypothetical protein LG296_21280 (plasmid) [Ureibacillus chungkukjangi]|jgi:hypothetical protein|uniref:hypothetical protein n=1 Tax=Ureibacillus chungkukjangi TaxID=1202712 RepID=UPI00384DD64D